MKSLFWTYAFYQHLLQQLLKTMNFSLWFSSIVSVRWIIVYIVVTCSSINITTPLICHPCCHLRSFLAKHVPVAGKKQASRCSFPCCRTHTAEGIVWEEETLLFFGNRWVCLQIGLRDTATWRLVQPIDFAQFLILWIMVRHIHISCGSLPLCVCTSMWQKWVFAIYRNQVRWPMWAK